MSAGRCVGRQGECHCGQNSTHQHHHELLSARPSPTPALYLHTRSAIISFSSLAQTMLEGDKPQTPSHASCTGSSCEQEPRPCPGCFWPGGHGQQRKKYLLPLQNVFKEADWLLLASISLEVQSVWLAADLLATEWRAGLHPVPSLASSSACPQSSNLLPQLPETGSDTSAWVVGCRAILDRFFCS